MEIKIIEESKNKLVFELIGEDHTFCNMLKEALTEDNTVDIAAYRIDHPLISNPSMVVESKNPRKAIENATKRIGKFLQDIEKEFKSIK